MKKALTLLLAVLLALAVCVPQAAQAKAVEIHVNGQNVYPDVPPQNINGRLMVPVRFVVEALDAQIDFSPYTNGDPGGSVDMRVFMDGYVTDYVLSTGDVDVFAGDTQDPEAGYAETRHYTLDVAPYIYQGRTMVPLRFISEVMGFTVDWLPGAGTGGADQVAIMRPYNDEFL